VLGEMFQRISFEQGKVTSFEIVSKRGFESESWWRRAYRE
jgi:hypothetical protein